MKRILCFCIVLCLLFTGCGILGERIKEPVTFYYIRTDYAQAMEPIIVSEEREASGHRYDLPYLLALYQLGSSSEELKSPLPRGTRINAIHQTEAEISLELFETIQTLSDAEFTLACACLSLTCMELTDAAQVTITSGDRSITMGADSLLLTDRTTTERSEEAK